MRINNKEYPNVSLNVVGDRKEPGLTGMKKICLYEATIKCGKKIQKMRSEHLGELQSWIEREVEPKMATYKFRPGRSRLTASQRLLSLAGHRSPRVVRITKVLPRTKER